MLRLSLNIFKLNKNQFFHTATVCNSQITKVNTNTAEEIPFFMKIFELNSKRTNDILIEHPNLLKVRKEDIIETSFLLKSLKIPIDQIWERPIILATSALTVENRYTILQECGLHNIDIIILHRYLSIMNKNTNIIKAHGLIKNEVNIKYQLLNQLNINSNYIKEKKINSDDNLTLNILRKVILDIYLKNKLNLNKSDLEKLWKIYPRIKHKSYASITDAIHFLKTELNFSNERIMNNGYLLHSDPKNLKNIVNKIQTLGDIDTREVMSRYPKIMMTNCDSILKTVKYLHAFNIPNSSIAKCFEIFTLSPETVHERLIDLKKVKEFNVLVQHPRILRLVHYQNKARIRLDYLRELKVKCVSLHILSTNSEAFERYARDGTDKTKGRDVTILLEQLLKIDEGKIRSVISRHPNWCHVPITSVKQTFDYLINKGFTIDHIFDNVHLLFYSIDRIDAEMVKIENKYNVHLDEEHKTILPSQILGLCLYYIELQYHFTGDGIWIDTINQNNDTMAVHPPELPKELVKKYKYGMKPTTNITYNNKIPCI